MTKNIILNYFNSIIFGIFIVFCVNISCYADLPGREFTKFVKVNQSKKIELQDGLDLSGKDLRNCNINRLLGELRNIKFDGSDLTDADLDETNFINCSFRNTKMIRVEAPWSDFEGCDFSGAIIDESNFDLSKEQFCSTGSYRNKNIQKARLYMDLKGVSFKEFNLTGVDLYGSCVHGCDFSNAIISDTYLSGKSESRAKGKDGGYIFEDSFSCKQLLTTANYKQGIILNVIFFGMDFSHFDFSKMNLTGCHFNPRSHPVIPKTIIYCDFNKTNMTDAVISNCIFRDPKNLTLEQIKSTWNYKVGRMDGIELPEHIQKALDTEKKLE
ncbi:MAG: pentapeptide repeat-containing protein [Planctomycetaceae bacterium]|jgi:uncharacterized protein YjbI with pentapeptide repeats|nr:pentapeptide repeat-containing protein [Planctomycetaceae bacterium]